MKLHELSIIREFDWKIASILTKLHFQIFHPSEIFINQPIVKLRRQFFKIELKTSRTEQKDDTALEIPFSLDTSIRYNNLKIFSPIFFKPKPVK